MSKAETIECRPTKWFYLRAGAMVLMFAVFLVLFLKDWKVGWPKKNEIYYSHQAFKKAKEAFTEHEKEGGTAEAWTAFAKEQLIGFPEGVFRACRPPASGPALIWAALTSVRR